MRHKVRNAKGRFAKAVNNRDRVNGTVKENRASAEVRVRSTGSEIGALYGSVFAITRQFIRIASGILLNSDIAYRRDQKLQRMMIKDPDVMGPLLQRRLSIALLDWDIIPDDRNDEAQLERAEFVKKQIMRMRKWTDYVSHMAKAAWYGPSAANMIYARHADGAIHPSRWRPFHPDSIVFDDEGNVGFRVGQEYDGERAITQDGFAHMLTPEEREVFTLHTWNPDGPEYDDAAESRFVFSGRGLRDTCWFTWLMKQTSLQAWHAYAQRYGMGIRIGKYPASNPAAKAEMDTAMANLIGDVAVTIPTDPNNPDAYDISILEPSHAGQKIFADLIEGYHAGQIKELLIGQTATTEATNTGLGSGVSDRHAETYGRIVRSDARALADTLTYELVEPIARYNGGSDGGSEDMRFEFAIEDVDSEQWMQGVQRAVSMGVEVGHAPVRQNLGIPKPEDGDKILLPPMRGDGMGMPEQDQGNQGFGGRLNGALNFSRVADGFNKRVSNETEQIVQDFRSYMVENPIDGD